MVVSSDLTSDSSRGDAWSIKRMIFWSADYLAGKGVEHSRLDAEWLLAEALNMDRLQLYLQYDRLLNPTEKSTFKSKSLKKTVFFHVLGSMST